MRRCLRVDMRLLQVAVSICAISLTACKKPQISPLTPIYSLQSSAEARVYRAFVKNHYDDDWKAFCPHAVLVTKPLSAETRDPSRLFSLQPDKPTNELIQQLNKTNDPQFVSLGNDTFFIPVDNEVINAMFRQPCSIEDAQQFDVDGCNLGSNMEQRAEHGVFLMSSSMLNKTKLSSVMI